jgi:hypothetical protein
MSLVIAILCLILQFFVTDTTLKLATVLRYGCVVLLLFSTFLGSWLFWAGFVKLAGHE